jgi:hypothetical protein
VNYITSTAFRGSYWWFFHPKTRVKAQNDRFPSTNIPVDRLHAPSMMFSSPPLGRWFQEEWLAGVLEEFGMLEFNCRED